MVAGSVDSVEQWKDIRHWPATNCDAICTPIWKGEPSNCGAAYHSSQFLAQQIQAWGMPFLLLT
jgi:hypothetical protein